MSENVVDMQSMIPSIRARRFAAAAAVLTWCLTGCGRGPVEQIGSPNNPTITIELFVSGKITPSEGDYIVALNTNTAAANVNFEFNGEQPGEPAGIEAYGFSSPEPYTHWDQAFVYGPTQAGFPNCAPAQQPGGFSYCYKSVSTSGGNTTNSFVPIILSPNSFTFIANANGGGGTANAMVITLPINCLSRNGTQSNTTCGPGGSVVQNVTNVYVNLVTLDNTGALQDQIACLSSQTYFVDLTHSATIQLVKPTNCPNPPSNANVLITGGLVIVNVPGT